jgi:ABC-type multidrug transport system permease subunit
MWWIFGGLATFLYIVLIVTLGMTTLRNGHGFMFILGIFVPLFWIIGAFMRPAGQTANQPS